MKLHLKNSDGSGCPQDVSIVLSREDMAFLLVLFGVRHERDAFVVADYIIEQRKVQKS